MAKKEQRFIKVMEDSGFISSNEVLVDTQTGVQLSLIHISEPTRPY